MTEAVIYVIWHPEDERGGGLAEAITAHFDGDEPVRDSLGKHLYCCGIRWSRLPPAPPHKTPPG